jgi:hypothetical protein
MQGIRRLADEHIEQSGQQHRRRSGRPVSGNGE